MWRGGNIWELRLLNRTRTWRGWALAAWALAALGVGAVGYPDQGDPSDRPARAVAPLLDWSHGLEAYRLAERWVAAGRVKPDPSIPPIAASGVLGVRVTLRWSGVTMGSAQSVVGPSQRAVGGPPSHAGLGPGVDLVPLIRQATQQALAQVAERLKDNPRRSINAGRDAAGKPQPAMTPAQAAPHLQLDLQIAYKPKRIVLPPDADGRALYPSFVCGYHGLRLARPGDHARRGDRWAWMWPGNAVAANMSAHRQLVRLLTDQGYRFDDLPRVARRGGPHLERFEVIHLVRPAADLPVVRLVRGHEVLATRSLSGRSLEGMAHRLAGFLIRRQSTDGKLAGTYHPSVDRYDPATASLTDTALAAYALGRRARRLSNTDASHAQLDAINHAVHLAVADLRTQVLAPPHADRPTASPAAAALTLMTLIESPKLASYKADRDALAKQLLAMRQDTGWFVDDQGGQPQRANRPTQALIVAALSSLYEQTRDQGLGRQVVASQDVLWEDTSLAGLINTLPWLGSTEFRLARLGPPQPKAAAGDRRAWAPSRWTTRGQMLGRLADQLRGRQIHRAPEAGPADVVGGFHLVGSAGLAQPDWHAAHLLAYLSSAMRQRDLTHRRDLVKWLVDCGQTTRFLAQLMFDEPGCYYVRSRGDVIGGVRTTLWDNRLGVGPTAMTLLAVTELQQTLSQINPDSVVAR